MDKSRTFDYNLTGTFKDANRRGLPAEELFERLDQMISRIDSLESTVRQQDRTIVGLQNELIRASRYKHDNLETRVDGIQILLAKAGEYRGRERARR